MQLDIQSFLANSILPDKYAVIIANGELPKANLLEFVFKAAETIISCDGATQKLIANNIVPDIIIGDLDSLSADLYSNLPSKIIQIKEQDSNDLTKALDYVRQNKYKNIIILGATGLREDHTLGNIGILAANTKLFDNIIIISDYGVLTAHIGSVQAYSIMGQQISFFAINPNTQITAPSLKWPLHNFSLSSWQSGTLNQATHSTLEFNASDYIILFRSFEIK